MSVSEGLDIDVLMYYYRGIIIFFYFLFFFLITIYSTFNIAMLTYMQYFIVCILSASEWIVSRFMALYK